MFIGKETHTFSCSFRELLFHHTEEKNIVRIAHVSGTPRLSPNLGSYYNTQKSKETYFIIGDTSAAAPRMTFYTRLLFGCLRATCMHLLTSSLRLLVQLDLIRLKQKIT